MSTGSKSWAKEGKIVDPNKARLTKRQRQILDWIKRFIDEHGMPPTVREIGGHFEIASPSVFDHLQALEGKGYLGRGGRSAQALFLRDQDMLTRCECAEVRVGGRAPGRSEAWDDAFAGDSY